MERLLVDLSWKRRQNSEWLKLVSVILPSGVAHKLRTTLCNRTVNVPFYVQCRVMWSASAVGMTNKVFP